MKYVPTIYLQLMMKDIPILKKVTYVLNNDVYVYERFGIWKRFNPKKLTNERVGEFCKMAESENQEVVVCWIGSLQHRREQVAEYLQYEGTVEE